MLQFALAALLAFAAFVTARYGSAETRRSRLLVAGALLFAAAWRFGVGSGHWPLDHKFSSRIIDAWFAVACIAVAFVWKDANRGR